MLKSVFMVSPIVFFLCHAHRAHQKVNILMPLVKRSITSCTGLNTRTPQDPPSTCWHNALSVLKSMRQSDFGHLYIFSLWTGLCRCWLRPARVLNVQWHTKHSYATPFQERSVAHDLVLGASYPPGPQINRSGFVIIRFRSTRTTQSSTSLRVMPDGQAPDSKWSVSAATEMNTLLQSRPGHLILLGWCSLELRCCWRLFWCWKPRRHSVQ